MTVSHLTHSEVEILAAALNARDANAGASSLSVPRAELLARIRNTYGSNLSQLTTGEATLAAGIDQAMGVAWDFWKNMSRSQWLATIVNEGIPPEETAYGVLVFTVPGNSGYLLTLGI